MTKNNDIKSNRTPVFILSGFLGSGKTTLLNEMLLSADLKGTAVIINEFGDIGLDHNFVESTGEEIIELSNGCLCCSIRSQLTDTLAALPLETLDRVIIEATGLADPGPMIQSILAHPEIDRKCSIGSVITLVDVLNIDTQVDIYEEPARQIALADAIIMTKTDMLDSPFQDAEIARITRFLRELNPSATIVDRKELRAPGAEFLDDAMSVASGNWQTPKSKSEKHHHADTGSSKISPVTLRTDKPISRRALEAFCELLASAHGNAILRIKGLVSVTGHKGPLIIHGVHQTFHEPVELEEWPDEDHSTRIVIITHGLDRAFIERLFFGFVGVPAVDTPDEAALIDNPLAISGNYRD
ncbi:MAG: GTP-binding protein [Pseudomonadota bacterium]